jgi:transposase
MTKPITDRPTLSGGRPTKYDPAFCEIVETEMANGLSLGAVAGILRVARSTINEWMEHYPEFSEAVSRAKAGRLLHWERAALNVATRGGGPGTATIIVFGLKNMGGDDWTDITKTEISGPGGKPIQTEETSARDLLAGKLARLTPAGRPPSDAGEPE